MSCSDVRSEMLWSHLFRPQRCKGLVIASELTNYPNEVSESKRASSCIRFCCATRDDELVLHNRIHVHKEIAVRKPLLVLSCPRQAWRYLAVAAVSFGHQESMPAFIGR
jgi:hypothetical protein